MVTTEVIAGYLLAAAVGLSASMRGGLPERLGAALLIADILFDAWIEFLLGKRSFATFSYSRTLEDVAFFAAYLVLALRANRLWPLWVAALQLIAVLGSIAPLVVIGGMQRAYWTITQVPAFIQILALQFGIILHHRRFRRLGNYLAWTR